jgi:hypothetical protein
MNEYRAYVVGQDGHIKGFRAYACASDVDATVWARQPLDDNDIELWSGERFVVRLGYQDK